MNIKQKVIFNRSIKKMKYISSKQLTKIIVFTYLLYYYLLSVYYERNVKKKFHYQPNGHDTVRNV